MTDNTPLDLDEIVAKLGEVPAGGEEGDSAAAAVVDKLIQEQEQVTAPEEIPASGEGEGQTEPALPAIEPPVSWNATAKDEFAKLPRHLQQVVAERERERESYLGRQTSEAAEAKKAADAERNRAAEERQRALQKFDAALDAVIASDPIIKEGRQINWQQLAIQDPNGYIAKKAIFDDRVQQLNAAIQQRQGLAAQVEQDNRAKQEEFLREQQKKLIEKVPEWGSDPEKARSAVREIADHARRYDISEDELSRVVDHRALLMIRDSAAMARENAELKAKLEKALATKEATLKEIQTKKASAPVPKTIAPGASSNEGKTTSERAKALINNARKSGRDSDRIDAVLAALEQR
jgi:hypothetical protein